MIRTNSLCLAVLATLAGCSGDKGGGGGHDPFDDAIELPTDGTHVDGDLDPTNAEEIDYYVITADPAQGLYLFTDARPDDDPFDPTALDLVVTAYDEDGEQIAQNDDPIPRFTTDSAMPFQTSGSGVAFLAVREFCSSPLADEFCTAERNEAITNHQYSIAVLAIPYGEDGYVQEVEPDDGPASATPVSYAGLGGGQYFATVVNGLWPTASDLDYFRTTLPADLDLDGGIASINVYAWPGGIDGDGSSDDVGMLTLYDSSGTTTIAEVDASLGAHLEVPASVATDYLVVGRPDAASVGARPYYFYIQTLTPNVNQPEVEPNGVYTQATVLTPFGESYFARGTLAPAAADSSDHFSFTAAPGDAASVECGAQTRGSGLRGLSFSLLDGTTGTAIPGSTSPAETAGVSAALTGIPLGGVTDVVLRVTAASEDPIVTSRFYLCGVHLAPP